MLKINHLKINPVKRLFLFLCCLSAFSGNLAVFSEEKPPERIVSLGPWITESLYLLKSEDRLSGCTTYCIRPEAARLKPRIGNILEINMEELIRLNPDLVLTTPLTDPKAIKKMTGLNFKLHFVPEIKTFEDLCREFILLGQILQKKKEAEEIAASCRAQLERLKTRIPKPAPSVFIQIGINPLFAATRQSSIHDMITYAGGRNIADMDTNGLYSREKVIRMNPDHIFIVAMGQEPPQSMNPWTNFPEMKSVKAGHVHFLDANTLCSPTPLTFAASVEQILNLLLS